MAFFLYFWSPNSDNNKKDKMKRLVNRYIPCTLLLGALVLASCRSKDVFDEEFYKQAVEIAQPVQGIDNSHTWELSSTHYITVETGGFSDMQRLQILSGNPAAKEGALILGDYPLSGEGREYVAFACPSVLRKYYAALVDDKGTYTLTAFTSDDRSIDFSSPVATRATVDERLVGLQAYTYCYEGEMPEPGDYDYNEVVLRVSQERTANDQITLNVTLAAVGAQSQIAAAIRLSDFKYSDIVSVTTVDNESFDTGYKKSALPFIDGNDLLLEGLDGSAVINVFEDAHWATDQIGYASEGYIPRYMYNVSKFTSEEFEMMPPRTVSFVITFKNPLVLNYFTLESIDPFAIIEYNGGLMENHAVYKYKTLSVLHEYSQPEGASILPWALTVPLGTFRYPLSGEHIGYAKDGALFGAYMTSGHAFGQWAASKDAATDWYNYPTNNMVY
jgi:LruC domain-containing protein